LLKSDRYFPVREGFTVVAEKADVGHHSKWVGHRDHSAPDLDPVPSEARGMIVFLLSP